MPVIIIIKLATLLCYSIADIGTHDIIHMYQ